MGPLALGWLTNVPALQQTSRLEGGSARSWTSPVRGLRESAHRRQETPVARQVTSDPLSARLTQLIDDCRAVLAQPGTKGEASLYTQFERFLEDSFSVLRPHATPGDEYKFLQQTNAEQTGVPDFRVQQQHELQGWVEVKAVIGKDLGNLAGHDANQLQRYRNGLANVIFTTGWQWRLYQHGQQIGRDVVLGPDGSFDHNQIRYPVSDAAVAELRTLLDNFLAAPSQYYASAPAAVTALAARGKALKLALLDVGVSGAGTNLTQLKSDFAALLYRNGLPFTWERFVDSYVQLATFGALLWRLETGQDISLAQQVGVSGGLHPLLEQCLVIMWSPAARTPILEPLLEELCHTVNNIDPQHFAVRAAAGGGRRRYLPDPIVHAYEPFFQAYDPATRETSGVYYTPVEIVEHIVAGVSDLIRRGLGRADGLLDEDARFLDPATGTGTFLLGLADAVAREATDAGLPVDQMVEQVLIDHTAAFELFPGPYTIAHQRLEVTLKAFGATASKRLPVYLADTLAAPVSGTLDASGFGVAGVQIEKERQAADALKTSEDILVIFGNPPYERVLEPRGGGFEPFAQQLFEELRLATPYQYRADLKSTKDLFVAFWVWALWALQSPQARAAGAQLPTIKPNDCHGIIGYITNRTWIGGRSLAGLRALVRTGAKEVWICDLGGDSRGAHGARSFAGGDGNVFGIRTGVAIAWVVFDRDYDGPAVLKYRRLYGTAGAKLAALRDPFDRADYEDVSGSGVDPFLPNKWGDKKVAASPKLTDLFADEPDTGVQTARDTSKYKPIGTEKYEVYAEVKTAGVSRKVGMLGEWAQLGSVQRYNAWATAQKGRTNEAAPDPQSLTEHALREYVYRPLDLRWLYDDPAWIDWYRPYLQAVYAHGKRVPSLVTIPTDHGAGPAVIHVDQLMDQHAFNNRGAKAVFTLWHPHQTGQPLPDLRCPVREGYRCGFGSRVHDWLDSLGQSEAIEAAYDYVLAVLSAPAYTKTHWRALESDFLRVPLTADPSVFATAASLGSRLRQAWTLAVPRDPAVSWKGPASVKPLGKASHSGDRLVFANGRELSGVNSDVWTFEVSNYAVLRSWFAARQHWEPTVSQARKAIAVVSAARNIADMSDDLNDLLDDAVRSAP